MERWDGEEGLEPRQVFPPGDSDMYNPHPDGPLDELQVYDDQRLPGPHLGVEGKRRLAPKDTVDAVLGADASPGL